MTWEIKWHPRAFRKLRSFPINIQQRIINRVKKLKEDPFYFLQHYEGKGYYKLRIGDYRALIDVDFKNKILEIQVFDHRKRIYK